jgi:hypothetical protein
MMRKTLICVAVCLAVGACVTVAALAGCRSVPYSGPYTGRVIDATTSEPIAGAELQVSWTCSDFPIVMDAVDTWHVKTGATSGTDGTFTITPPRKRAGLFINDYDLTVRAKGYEGLRYTFGFQREMTIAINPGGGHGERWVGVRGRRSAASPPPVRDLLWQAKGAGFKTWGSGGEFAFAHSEGEVFYVWRWQADTLERYREVPLAEASSPIWMGADVAVWEVESKERQPGVHQPLLARNIATGKELARFAPEKGWYYSNTWNEMKLSGNGKFLAVHLAEDSSYPPADHDPEVARCGIGLLGPACDKLARVATLARRRGYSYSEIRSCVPSNNGAHVAVSGWQKGLSLVDAQDGKVLWDMSADAFGDFGDIAFSPPGDRVYAGTRRGFVYGMEVATGKIVSKWPATEGESNAFYVISRIATSPDGRLVAAATEPSAQIYVWHADTGERCAWLEHDGGGQVLILMFSPDSKHLASFAGGRIKIWAMPPGKSAEMGKPPQTSGGDE